MNLKERSGLYTPGTFVPPKNMLRRFEPKGWHRGWLCGTVSVSRHQALFDRRDTNYKNEDLKDNVLHRIASQLLVS